MTAKVLVKNVDAEATVKVGVLEGGEVSHVEALAPRERIVMEVGTTQGLVIEEVGEPDEFVGPPVPPAMEPDYESIAKACHEANRAYCATIGESQPSWDEAPDWQKESAIAGVRHAIDNPDATPEDSHLSWLMVKTAEGWTHGEVKDAEAKTHPCMVDYADLPEEQRRKDEIFLDVVRQKVSYAA